MGLRVNKIKGVWKWELEKHTTDTGRKRVLHYERSKWEEEIEGEK